MGTLSYPGDNMIQVAQSVRNNLNSVWPRHNQILNGTILDLEGLFPESAEALFYTYATDWDKCLHDGYNTLDQLMQTLSQASTSMASEDRRFSQGF